MKNTLIFLTIAAILAAWLAIGQTDNKAPSPPPKVEYAFIRWDGFDNSHVIKPNNEVVMMGSQLRKFRKPPGVDDRHFYQTAMMNILAQEGWQFLTFYKDDVVMQRHK